jgi:ATP-dependent protease ClpP protease subunit
MRTTAARNETGGEDAVGEIQIYGYIAEEAWWDDDTSPKSFSDELKTLGDIKTLRVYINSYGGHVSASSAIYSILKRHQAKVIVHIDGFALSGASIIAMAGDTVIMPGNSMMMIHNPSEWAFGDSRDLRREADALDKTRDSMIAVYHDKTGLRRDELIQMLDDETWFTADEAAAKGFADIVEEPLMAVASVKPGILAVNGVEFDLTGYRNTPEKLKREMEGHGMDDTKNMKPHATASINTVQAEPDAPPASGRGDGNTSAEEMARAVLAERERIKALDSLLIPGAEDIIAKAKYETGASPEQIAVEIIKASKQVGITLLENRKTDAAESGVNSLASTNSGAGLEGTGSADEKARALKEAIEKGREGK